jgi:hypothetical protein
VNVHYGSLLVGIVLGLILYHFSKSKVAAGG